MNNNFDFSKDGISFVDADANIGVKNLGLKLVIEGSANVICYDNICTDKDTIIGEGCVGGSLRIITTVNMHKKLNAVVLQHKICNSSPRPIWINSAATGQFSADAAILHGKGGWLGMDLRYCHTDNVRTERYPHCQMEYPLVRMLPVETVQLGMGQDQSFPALYIKDERGKNGIVFAAASQELNYTAFEMRKQAMVNESVFDVFAILHDPGQTGGFQIPAGSEVSLDGIFIQLTGDVAVEDAYVDYINFIAERFNFRGPKTPLLNQAFHCTWNYGIFADQTEKSLMPTATFIAQNLPNIKYFLMDAGYLVNDISSTFLDKFYPDPNQHVVADKWPDGIRGYMDKIRNLGMRPGIWWSPTVTITSQLYIDHPDWFLRKNDGSLYIIGEANGFLDYSHPGALEFLDKTLAVILGEWGVDACKMDFWSQNFEDRNARLYDPTKTAVQMRTDFFNVIRKNLPEDGIFMTCVATGMGNPFIGQWADTYRNTIDIGIGKWHEQKENCIWALPTLSIEGRKTFLLNNDSAGIMAEYPDNENYFRLAWSYINMGMIETGGRMETWSEQWVKAMKKLTDRCDRGHRCKCPDEKAFTGLPLPELLYVDFPDDSQTARAGVKQSIAIFNWDDEPKIISVRRESLGHTGPVKAQNFWTGEIETFDGEFISKRLDGRSSLLYDVVV
jgi:hypothetical protein